MATLSEFLPAESIVAPLEAPSREAAVARLVAALALPGSAADRDDLAAAVLAREAAGSTGLGNGVAIPHARTRRLAAPRLAVGRAAKPVDFHAADGKPVTLIFLLAVPESDPRAHLSVLAALSRIASDKKLLKALGKAESAGEIYDLLASAAV